MYAGEAGVTNPVNAAVASRESNRGKRGLAMGGDDADTRSEVRSTTMETTTTTAAGKNQQHGTLRDTEYEATFKMAKTA